MSCTVTCGTPRIVDIQVTDDSIIAQLADGRTISVPLVWSWRLSDATPEQRGRYEIIGNGLGVHWPDIDEDISAAGMLYGIPARPPKARVRRQRSQLPPLQLAGRLPDYKPKGREPSGERCEFCWKPRHSDCLPVSSLLWIV